MRKTISPDVSTACLAVWAMVALISCGGSNPNDPTEQAGSRNPTVGAIVPVAGTTLGGTNITISGTNFAAGATVTIGGVAATDVSVQGTTTITARTPQHASGAADVVVAVGGRSGSLAGAFRFEAPAATVNQPPSVSGFETRSARARAPNGFADLGDTLIVTATVTDAETPADQLRYEWTSDVGTFSGTGREVTWRAPEQATTPGDVRLNVTIIESYETVNAQGLPVAAEHRVPGLVTVRLHDSIREVRDLSVGFLTEFSQQRVAPDQMVRNFSDSCPGKRAERDQVRDHQADLTVTSYSVQSNPPIDIDFGGTCRDRGRIGDGCAYVQVRWESTYKGSGKREVAVGVGQLNAIYEDRRWQLCDSDFLGTVTVEGRPAMRPFVNGR